MRRLLLAVLFFFLPIAAQAQPATSCCKCYKGPHTTENSFCIPAPTPAAGCVSALATLSSPIHDVSPAGATLTGDVVCDSTVLTGASCDLLTSGTTSAQCRITTSDTNALCSALATISHGSCPLTAAASSDTSGLSDAVDVPFTPITPSLGVAIPGTTLSPATKDGATVRVAFLAQYINGVYHYLTAIILVVAIVMCVYGAFLYLLGSGGVGSIQRGKEIIINSIMGMLITLAGYAILNTVNPNTVNLKVLDLAFVTDEELEFPPGIDYGEAPESSSSSGSSGSCSAPRRSSSDTVYDSLFQRYAPCAGLDWRILKAVAYRESGFRECVTNAYGFTGLFQVATRTCALRNHGRAADCNRLTNPEVNTAAASIGQLRDGANILARRCPSITDPTRYVTLLYYEHNSGPGALGAVITAVGCNATDDQYDAASAHFWESYSERHGRALPPNYNNRMNFARSVAALAVGYGVSRPTVASSGCPID